MNFATDRDLLLLEPHLFHEVFIASQQRLRVSDADLDGTSVFSPTADFTAAGAAAGSVVLIDAVAFEVVERVSDSVLTVSLPRTRTSDPAIPGGTKNDVELTLRTFAPQAALVHDALLRLLGIEHLGEEAVISLNTVTQLEALGTLERVYASAAAVAGENETLLHKAATYRRRFRHRLATATVRIDVNGDGLAEETRTPGLTRLVRV